MERYPVGPTLAAEDLERAERWYTEKLGLTPTFRTTTGLAYPAGGQPLGFAIYLSPNAGTNRATYAAWVVDDIDAVMARLRERGVVFEDYDIPGVLKTRDGIGTSREGNRTAWFTDSEGNILSLVQLAAGSDPEG